MEEGLLSPRPRTSASPLSPEVRRSLRERGLGVRETPTKKRLRHEYLTSYPQTDICRFNSYFGEKSRDFTPKSTSKNTFFRKANRLIHTCGQRLCIRKTRKMPLCAVCTTKGNCPQLSPDYPQKTTLFTGNLFSRCLLSFVRPSKDKQSISPGQSCVLSTLPGRVERLVHSLPNTTNTSSTPNRKKQRVVCYQRR